ncbi:MAG: hypothetical protein R8K46_05880 [Mariprofundaceae bacterium]
MQENHKERGFVLVSVVVLLAILTTLGATAMFKSSIEVSVSVSAEQGEQALAAANAGLAENFAYWRFDSNGNIERDDILAAMKDGTPSPFHYDESLAVSSMFSLNQLAGGDIDNWIKGSSVIRVYDVLARGMDRIASANWASGINPQVAIWATSYHPQTGSAYPYASPNASLNAGGCADCKIVVYALGRSGTSRRLLREIQVTTTEALAGVAALTNAPPYGSFDQACMEADNKTDLGNISAWKASINNTAVEVTQAPYIRNASSVDSKPSGVAIKSNTDLGGGGKGFRKQDKSTTGASFEFSPLLNYSGHGSGAAANESRGNDADTIQDNTNPYDNLDQLGAHELPHNLVMAPTMNTDDEMTYFSDANAQLFNLDAYRWAAEEFVCQDPSKPDGSNGNGRYCSKAEALRLAVGGAAPVAGRLTVAEFEYNVNYGFPMFGMVRVMLPTTGSGTNFSCTVNGQSFSSEFYEISGSVATMETDPGGGSGFYDGSISTVDSDGILDGTARVLVYGSLFFDFFTDEGDPSISETCETKKVEVIVIDKKGKKKKKKVKKTVCTNNDPLEDNNVFDPAASGGGERLLEPLEAVDSYMKIEFPILINPTMPRGSLGAFPTAAGGTIATGVSSNPVNLAAPTGGYFPPTEGLVLPSDSDSYEKGLAGTMRLMSNQNTYGGFSMPSDGLVSISEALEASGTFPPAGAPALFSAHEAELEYYYDLAYKTAKQSDSFSWPMAAFPQGSALSGTFYIGVEDAAAGHNDGDMLHLLFPSAYMHGWKVALAALNLTASDWNNLLTDLASGLASQHATHRNYGDSAMPKGSPFNTVEDAGYSESAALETEQSKFFYVDDTHTSGYGLLTEEWRDIPAEMYVGGLLDMHAHANINGVVYTPGPLEWEPGNSEYAGNDHHLAYISGAIITGYGAYVKNKVADGRYVLSYSNDTLDNLNTNNAAPKLERSAWQALN